MDLSSPIPFFDILAVCLAAGAVVRAWMKDDGLFANVRDDLYLWVDHPDGETRLRRLGLRIMALIGKLANCPFCQTYHVVLALLILWWLARNVFPSPWDDATIYGIYWLALVRVAHRLEGDYNARGS